MPFYSTTLNVAFLESGKIFLVKLIQLNNQGVL
jgi:hypothetical protein